MMQMFLIIAPLVIFIGLLVYIWMRSRKPPAPKEDHTIRQRRAVWAMATIKNLRTEPSSLGTMSRVYMDVYVRLPGSEPYDAVTTWLVKSDSLDLLENGKDIGVRIDPQNPQYVYPNGNWATFVE